MEALIVIVVIAAVAALSKRQPTRQEVSPPAPDAVGAAPAQSTPLDDVTKLLPKAIAAGGAIAGLVTTGSGTAATGAATASGGGAAAGTASATGSAAAGTAAAVSVGAVAAAALPVGYIIGFIAGGEIAKAQERAKDAQSRIAWLMSWARGLNAFESALIKMQLDAWKVSAVASSWRDPRMDVFARGSALVLPGYRVMFSSLSPDILAQQQWAPDVSKLVGRTRQAALTYLEERSYWGAKLYRSLVPTASAATMASFDFTRALNDDALYGELGGWPVGGISQVPDPLGGPASLPMDADALPVTAANMRSYGGPVRAAVDVRPEVMKVARLWALREAVAAAAWAWPGQSAAQLWQRLGSPSSVTPTSNGLELAESVYGFGGPVTMTTTGDVTGIEDATINVVPDRAPVFEVPSREQLDAAEPATGTQADPVYVPVAGIKRPATVVKVLTSSGTANPMQNLR